MDNPEVTPDAGAAEPEGTPSAAPEVSFTKEQFQGVVDQRQAEKAKRRELAAKVAEYEAKAKETADAKMREQGEFQKLLEAEKAEKSKLEQQLHSMQTEQRSALAVDAVTNKIERADRSIVHALMLLQEKQGVDIAPEEVSTDFVDAMVGRIKSVAPQLFQPQGIGGTPGVPGTNTRADGDDARIDRLAKKYSAGR
ncbi:MAG: OmpH family outer membrane protein [Pseudomonadaceae bacterium]